MRIVVLTNPPRVVRVLGNGSALAEGPCPACAALELFVAGTGRRPSSDDRAWEADGYALCCGHRLGVIRAEVDTVFGVREDRAVLEGRARVY